MMQDRRGPDDVAKVLIYDIETGYNLGYTFDKHRAHVPKFKTQWYMLSVAWKWLGTRQVHCLALPDFPLYKREPENDRELAKALHKLLGQADATVTHNGIAFDNKKANARFAVHSLHPLPPRKDIDTCQIARRQFGFVSNSLADLCDAMDLPHKGDPGSYHTWLGCMAGDPKAWAKMRRYNKQDIPPLEALYLRLRPWMKNHPNLNVFGDRPEACAYCQHDVLHARGYRLATVTKRRVFQCQNCFAYCMGREIHDTRIKYRSV